MARSPSPSRAYPCESCKALAGFPCTNADGAPISRYHAPRRRFANLDPDPSGTPGWTRKKRR